ncbi:MAG TPA: Ig-like domain repeat protein [Acidobacteriaceae bacterium]|nr:Ig-like domain repeat protein [Acidobacteriaceae bacterium]
MRCLQKQVLCVVMGLVIAGVAEAQDQRNVLEPVIPPVCTTLTAELASGTTPGTISNETQLDSPRIQAAMNACPAGQAVELATGTDNGGATNDAFLTGPLTIPKGVTLLVDAGVTLYASRNPRDYDSSSAHTCGTVDNNGNGCNPIINVSKTVGAGIVGYGTIDGRGYMRLLLNGQPGPESWWDLAHDADVNGGSQNNPRLINGSNPDRLTLYKIRLMNSPMFHVALDVPTNFTAWGVKIVTPYDARNSDGIDPGYGTNVTITQSHISDGDDQVAIGGNKLPGASYYSVTNDWFGNGHGLSIGSYTLGGVRHLLAQNLTWSGLATDSNATAVHIKSDVSRGGVVQDLTYQNICSKDLRYAIWLDPFYSGLTKTGTLLPWYKDITIQNLHQVTPSTTATTTGQVLMQGFNSTVPTEVTLDNVVVDGIVAKDFVSKFKQTTPTNSIITVGPDPVNFVQFLTGPGVTLNDNISNSNPPYDCRAEVFAPIAGEIVPGPAQIDPGTKPMVNVQVLTTKAVPYQTYLANLASDPNASLALTPPTGTVTVYDGATAAGSAMLPGASNSGMQMVPVQLGPLSAGTHTLTAQYSGDSNYPAFTFGSYAVSVGRGDTSNTSLNLSATSVMAGDAVTLTAFVGGHGHSTPAGTVEFTAGSVNLGSAPANSQGSATVTTSSLTPGTYNVIASFTGQQGSTSSQSSPQTLTVTQIPTTLALTANPATAVTGTAVTITATVSYPATSLQPSGTVTIKDGSTTIATLALVDGSASFTTSTLTAGTHSLSASYSGDANFVKSSATGSVTITAQ